MVRGLFVGILLLALSAAQMPDAREALRLGRTQDEALYAAFLKGYSLAPAEPIAAAEIITEFRRAVMIVREHAQQGEYGFTERDLNVAMKPHLGRITFRVEVRLHPLNTYRNVPAYDLYIASGTHSPPIATDAIKRDPVYAMGDPSALVGVRLEATMPRDAIAAATAPELVVTDQNADVVWRTRIDLARFR